MNAVGITVISVVGTALFGMFYMQFQNLRADMRDGFKAVNTRLDHQEAGLHAMEAKLTDKFTGELRALDDKFTGELKAQGERIDRVLDVLRNHGERLARIETRLDIDPPAEAA